MAIKSILQTGSNGLIVEAECHLSNGLPTIIIVGLGNKAVDEARERIRSAFASSHIQLPKKRITINLAPADVPKESTSLDVAIALSILQTSGQIKPLPADTAVIGELGLEGDIRSVRGIIGKLLIGKRSGVENFFIPFDNGQQASLVPDCRILTAKSLTELYTTLTGQKKCTITATPGGIIQNSPIPDMLSEIAGQNAAKRALSIAAAGGHNIFISGAPGTGKTMLAKALPCLLPPLTQEEMLEVTHLHSLVSADYEQLVTQRPFRAPHHSASIVALVGGGAHSRPGEISLSHRGVLFLDEMPEFNRSTLEALRQPLEDRVVTVARIKGSVTYPAHFMLVATANPCPCGYYGTGRPCECPAHRITQYRQRISGPILDRIDLFTVAEDVKHDDILTGSKTQDTAEIRNTILEARNIQQARFKTTTRLNSSMTNKDLKDLSKLETGARALLATAAEKLQLSARSYVKIIKIARTIADLEQSEAISTTHIAEALQYRPPKLKTLD